MSGSLFSSGLPNLGQPGNQIGPAGGSGMGQGAVPGLANQQHGGPQPNAGAQIGPGGAQPTQGPMGGGSGPPALPSLPWHQQGNMGAPGGINPTMAANLMQFAQQSGGNGMMQGPPAGTMQSAGLGAQGQPMAGGAPGQMTPQLMQLLSQMMSHNGAGAGSAPPAPGAQPAAPPQAMVPGPATPGPAPTAAGPGVQPPVGPMQ